MKYSLGETIAHEITDFSEGFSQKGVSKTLSDKLRTSKQIDKLSRKPSSVDYDSINNVINIKSRTPSLDEVVKLSRLACASEGDFALGNTMRKLITPVLVTGLALGSMHGLSKIPDTPEEKPPVKFTQIELDDAMRVASGVMNNTKKLASKAGDKVSKSFKSSVVGKAISNLKSVKNSVTNGGEEK